MRMHRTLTPRVAIPRNGLLTGWLAIHIYRMMARWLWTWALILATSWFAACARGYVEPNRVRDAQVADQTVERDANVSDRDIVEMDVSREAAAEVATSDAGPCLAIRGTLPFVTMADTTGGAPFDRGFATVQTSDCPLTGSPTDVTRGSPSRSLRFCNPAATQVRFSLAVHATYDVWTAVYRGDQVPADTMQCLVMNDDDRRPGRSTTDSFIPEVTLEPGAVVTVVVTGLTNDVQHRGPFELTATPL